MEDRVTIIIVDDKENWRKSLREELEEHKIITVAEASNGFELLKIMKRVKADIVLLDLAMPLMDGNATMSHLEQYYPEQNVLIMTQHNNPTLMEDYKIRGARGSFDKDDVGGNISTLVDILQRIKRGKDYSYFPEPPKKQRVVFTSRQKEILALTAEDKTNDEIAREIGITVRGVENHKRQIKDLLGITKVSQFYRHIYEGRWKFFKKRTHK